MDIKDCAESFDKLTDYKFEFEIFRNYKIDKIELIFDVSDFKHLSGLEKLSDIPAIVNSTPKQLFKNIINSSDSNKIDSSLISSSTHYGDQLNKDVKESQIPYYISDRINQLSYLYDYLHNIFTNNKLNIKIYYWDRNADNTYRPNNSQVKADFLLEIQKTIDSKCSQEHTNFFVIKRNNVVNGVSLITSDISYSDDGRRSVSPYKILSVKEKCISKKNTVTLFDISQQERQSIQESIANQNNVQMINNDISSLKKVRSKVLSKPNNENAKSKYEKTLNKFTELLKKGMYQISMIEEVLKRLNQQLDDSHDDTTKDLISKEINKVKEVAKQRGIDVSKYSIINHTTEPIFLPPSDTAVLQTPAIPMIQPPSFDNLSKDIRNIFNKIKNALDNLTKPSKQTKSNTNKKNTQKSKQSATNKQRTTNRSSSQGARKSTVKTSSKSKEKPATKQPEQPKKPTFRISRSKMNENSKKVNQKNKSSEKGTRSKNKNNNVDL